MARFLEDAQAIIGLEGRGSRFASSRLSRTLISTRPPRGNEAMTPLGVRALSRPGGDRGAARAGRPSRPRVPSGGAVRVVGHDAGHPHARFEAVAGGGHVGPGPWNASSPALEIRDQLRPRLVQVGFVDNTVAIKDGSRLVSGQDHGDAFRDPRADQIARRRPPAIMQEPARDPRLATRPRPRAPPRPHRRLIPREHPEVPGAPPRPPAGHHRGNRRRGR